MRVCVVEGKNLQVSGCLSRYFGRMRSSSICSQAIDGYVMVSVLYAELFPDEGFAATEYFFLQLSSRPGYGAFPYRLVRQEGIEFQLSCCFDTAKCMAAQTFARYRCPPAPAFGPDNDEVAADQVGFAEGSYQETGESRHMTRQRDGSDIRYPVAAGFWLAEFVISDVTLKVGVI